MPIKAPEEPEKSRAEHDEKAVAIFEHLRAIQELGPDADSIIPRNYQQSDRLEGPW